MFATLAPGPDLDDLNKSILNRILPDVNNLAKAGPTKTKMWYWLRHHFSLASTGAIWGLRNPFLLYPDVEPTFWEFEANAMPLTMMPFPQLVSRLMRKWMTPPRGCHVKFHPAQDKSFLFDMLTL